jgi:hypothetical protein
LGQGDAGRVLSDDLLGADAKQVVVNGESKLLVDRVALNCRFALNHQNKNHRATERPIHLQTI